MRVKRASTTAYVPITRNWTNAWHEVNAGFFVKQALMYVKG
jgi:hypothetical protein